MDQRPVPSPFANLEPIIGRHRLDSENLPLKPRENPSPDNNYSGGPLESTVETPQLGSGPFSQRVYKNTSSQGHSRNVYGDIYNIYRVHSQDRSASGPAHPSTVSEKAQDDAATTLMNALAFDRMETRLATINDAHAQTCQWLFAREEYTSWRDPEALQRHHGFFWIKGKPGAGKSTLMKCAQQYGGEKYNDLVISFFFNARGEELQRSAEGMYRSLLYQLLDAVPGLALALGKFSGRLTKQSWALAELESMLATAVRALGPNAVTCYIDALDECDDEEARKMIEHFETLGQCASKADTKFRVLLSSRHYPQILLDDCLELILEDQGEHEADIAEYIRCKLKIGKGRPDPKIKEEIQTRACGVFLWVVLVIRILNEYNARGKTHLLRKRLANIPDGLGKLFEEILQRGAHDSDDTLLTFQLILFAQRPLRREELYFAVVTKFSDDTTEEWDRDEITPDVMERFLLNSSKGLAELTKGTTPTVQFIHESVRDYLLNKGFTVIDPGLSGDMVSLSHERLRDCCLHSLERSKAALLPTPYAGRKKHMPQTDPNTKLLRDRVTAAHPFLLYAVHGVLHHANLTDSQNRPQETFVARFPHALWRRCYNLCCMLRSQRLSVNTQPLYTFVLTKAQKLANIEIRRMSCKVQDRLEGEHYRSLLVAAIDQGDRSMMSLLLEHGADPNDHSEPNVSLCLSLAIHGKDPAMVCTLIEHGAGPTCVISGKTIFEESLRYALRQPHSDQDVIECILTRAPYSLMQHWSEALTETLIVSRNRGYHYIEKLLLGRMQVIVTNLTTSKASVAVESLGDAFVAACGYGELAIVNLLIKHDILRGSNKVAQAFHAAVRAGCDETVRILIENGVEVDMRLDDHGTTALIVASARGHADLVRLLLCHGAQVPRLGLALHAAAEEGHHVVVQMLLDAGADPNTRGTYPETESEWSPTLHMAVRSGSEETVRVLLEHASTNVDALDGYGDHAICTASSWGHVGCAQLLLRRGIPLEHLNNAVTMASKQGFSGIVRILKGAIFSAK